MNSPTPKKNLLSSDLTRPDWTKGDERDKELIWLDKNENLDPILANYNSDIIKSIISDSLNVYPESYQCYRKLAKWANISSENLLLTPGSDGAIRAVFEAYVGYGDIVLHTSPTFAMYYVYCKMYGAVEKMIEYEASSEGPTLCLGSLVDSIKKYKPKLVCLPNPDSPTGNVFKISEIEVILDVAREFDTVVLIDEAYHPFYEETVIGLINRYENLIVARTFAKAWGLAGLRIGYAVSNKGNIVYLHKIRPMYEVNTIAVSALTKILDHSDMMLASVKRLKQGKKYFLQEMQKMNFKIIYREGNFLHVNFGDFAKKIHENLSDLVLYRQNFNDPCLAGYSRFSATTEDEFKIIVERIKKIGVNT
jgi:histidinol-phosphate aminotransferase